MMRCYATLQGRGACSPARLIKRSPVDIVLRDRDGDTVDIIEWILYVDAHSAEWIIAENAQCLRGATDYETMHNVWRFVKHNLRYKPDRPGHELVKFPGALFTSGEGDCKSFSIAEGALLRALGIPYKYRFTAYDSGDFTHVYVVALLDGREVIMDAVPNTQFDKEVPYDHKKDMRPAKVAQVHGCKPIKSNNAACKQFFAIGLLAYLIFR